MKPMNEVFELPVEADSGFDHYKEVLLSKLYLMDEQARHAAYAINMHDSLVEALEVLIMHTDRNKPNSVVLNHVHTVLSKARGE